MADDDFAYVWHLKAQHSERKGESCRVEFIDSVRIKVQFRDGTTIQSHRSAVRIRALSGPRRP